MKPLKPRDLRELSDEELIQKYRELKKELFEMRIKHKFGQLENTSAIRITRRNIARVLTILNERGIKL